ncbi:hypothetical protein EG329_014320 [Mollisiaceae sp. DMI_Dod_QoI]|nr:hypothetical protein EG329_014320 [Helotiales sp. DMI_Dod_QoI]
MPPRRSHKKSKAGCQRCKNRKIKCDEVHPACGNCLKHGVPCDFEGPITPSATTPSFARQDTTESSSHASSMSTPRTTASAIIPFYQQPQALIRAQQNPAASRSLELKLMHHFTARTCLTFSDTLEQSTAWQVDIPTIAYDAQYLMDAILAVSALHLRVMHPDDQNLIRASHSYMASALAQYSSLLNQGVSEFNSEALFSTSALIAFQASASRLFDEDGPYQLPLAWFHSFQGVKAVVMASWQWLRTSDKIYPIINSQPALFLDLDPERKLFFAPLLDGLEEYLETFPESIRAETKQAYVHAVAFLNWAHRRPARNRILGFAATVSRRFVDLMAQHDPRTLVIASCFFALTKMVDGVWWLQGIAKREVNGIYSLLPPEWRPKMEWSLRIVNHEGIMDEETWGGSLDEFFDVKKEENNVHEHIDLLARIMNECNPPLPPD